MAFLDNSGDIILDAVLTDAGRMRMARGDGSFRVTKFALGDDEINYQLFDKNQTTAYQDLQIMQTPVLEAFTNNIASLNSRLISIPRNDILYLPVMKINDLFNNNRSNFADFKIVKNGYILLADSVSEEIWKTLVANNSSYSGQSLSRDTAGVFNGVNPNSSLNYIRVDQGIDNARVMTLDSDLIETQFLLEVDNKLMKIISTVNQPAERSYIDDDDIAGYYFSVTDTQFVKDLNNQNTGKTIAGPMGRSLMFSMRSSDEIFSTDILFDRLGTNITNKIAVNGIVISSATLPKYTVSAVKSIVTNIVVTGLTTGYSVQIPIVIIKFITT